jgi:hypothetical protein
MIRRGPKPNPAPCESWNQGTGHAHPMGPSVLLGYHGGLFQLLGAQR